MDDLETLIRELADTPTSSETPGVYRDDVTDELIGMARKWVEREDGRAKFKADLLKTPAYDQGSMEE